MGIPPNMWNTTMYNNENNMTLREKGEKAKKIIEDTKPAAVGDLVEGMDATIDDLIDSLHDHPKLQRKAAHLEGMFRELMFGEEYITRNDEGYEKKEEENEWFPNVGGLSGVIPNTGIVASGMVMGPPLTYSFTVEDKVTESVTLIGEDSKWPKNPCDEVPLEDAIGVEMDGKEYTIPIYESPQLENGTLVGLDEEGTIVAAEESKSFIGRIVSRFKK